MSTGTLEPIFIVGCQRSGTTLTASLLGGAPDVIVIPEAQFVAELAPADPAAILDLAGVIDTVTRHLRFTLWGFDLRGERPQGRGTYADAIRWLVRRYARARGKPDPRRWIDHQPGHVREMETLRAHFPGLRAIHVVRDGRGVAASVMPLAWGPNGIQAAANFWAQRTAMGLAMRDYLGREVATQIAYERIVGDSEAALRELSAFLGLGFDPGMLEGRGFVVPRFTRMQHALVGKRPDSARIDAWRDYLRPREIEQFEALVGPLLTYLGYERIAGARARLPSFSESVRLTLHDQLRGVVNRWRFRRLVAAERRREPAAGDGHAPDRMDVGDGVSPEQATRLEREAIGPF